MAGKPHAQVLVAEDNRTTRTFLRYKLEKAGYEVVTAQNGKEALDLLTDRIGAVLLDLQMPEMDGMACLGHIHRSYSDIQPIIITANEDVSMAVEAMKFGAFDYLTKPLNPEELVTIVNKAVQSHEQSRRLRQVESELARAREHEAFIAAKIQQTLLIGRPPSDFEGLRIAELTIPSLKIDGDFYDFFRVNDRCIDLVVGDVMGKGIPAALLGAAAKNHFLRILYELVGECGDRHPTPAAIVAAVQRKLIDRLEELQNFITLCYARFDLEERRLIYVDCGHVRTIHYHRESGDCRLVHGGNMPIGFPETEPYIQKEYPLSPGDLFFFYSDGLTEARNPDGEFYGESRVAADVRQFRDALPGAIIEGVRHNIVSFTGTEVFSDDFTCVVVRIDDE